MAKIARRKLAAYIASELHNGADVQKLAQQVVAYLGEHRQVNQLELLLRDVEAVLASEHGVVPVRISSAYPLAQDTRQAITEFVKAAEGARSVVITDEATDEALIGGAIITTPSSTFDNSVRTQLRQLTATTKE